VSNCIIDANQLGNANYNAAPQVQQTVSGVAKGNQTITFTSTAPTKAINSGNTYTVTAAATSTLTVAFTSNTPTICTSTGTNGATITFILTGTCTINANQTGSANWNAAPQVQQTITVVTLTVTRAAVGTGTSANTVTSAAFTPVSGATYVIAVSYVGNTSQTCSSVASATGTSLAYSGATNLVPWYNYSTSVPATNYFDGMCVFTATSSGVTSTTVRVTLNGSVNYSGIQVIQITGDASVTIGLIGSNNMTSVSTAPVFNLGGIPSASSGEVLFGDLTIGAASPPAWAASITGGFNSVAATQSLGATAYTLNSQVYFGAAAPVSGSVTGTGAIGSPGAEWGTIGIEIKP
jgi:hypothetical protein